MVSSSYLCQIHYPSCFQCDVNQTLEWRVWLTSWMIAVIHTVLVNVSGTVDSLRRVEGVLTSPRLVVPAVIVVPVRVVVGAGISVHVMDHLIGGDHVPVMGYRHPPDPRGHGGRVPIRGPSVRHQLYCNVHPSNGLADALPQSGQSTSRGFKIKIPHPMWC